MSKVAKVVIILAIIVLIAGTCTAVWGFYKNDWRTDNMGVKYETKTFESEQEFNEIVINVVDSGLTIERGDKFLINYNESNQYPISIAIENNVLNVKSEKKIFSNWFNFHLEALNMHITVPYDLDSIHANSLNGAIVLKNLDIDTAINGNIDIATSNGALKLDGISAKNINGKTSNGLCELNNVKAQLVDFKTSNGAMRLENTTAENIAMKTSNGAISTKSTFADIAKFKTSNGAVNLEIAARDIEATTTNGKIIANVYGDEKLYNVSLRGMNQDKDIKGENADYRITFNTKTSKCELTFTRVGE